MQKKRRETHEKEGITVSFFPSSVAGFFFITPWTTETASTKTKVKKTELSREDHVSSKVGFFKFCYLLFLANNYEIVILNIETIFWKTLLLPLLVELELELELETKSPFGAETETNI